MHGMVVRIMIWYLSHAGFTAGHQIPRRTAGRSATEGPRIGALSEMAGLLRELLCGSCHFEQGSPVRSTTVGHDVKYL